MAQVTDERLAELVQRFRWSVSLSKVNADNENYSAQATIAELQDAEIALRELQQARTKLAGVEAAWLAYKNRGAAPAPNEYQALAKVLNDLLSAADGKEGK